MKRSRENDNPAHESINEDELPEWWDVASSKDDDASDLDENEQQDFDDARWDVFLADDDELDPLPEHGDFWFEDE